MTTALSGGSTAAHKSSHKATRRPAREASSNPARTAAAPVGPGALRLLVEPAAGVSAIDTLITGARYT